MSQQNVPGGAWPPNLQLKGGVAIVAPPSAFPSGIPGNALIVVPLAQPSDELLQKIQQGPVAIQVDDMWRLLGFNGPAVQVQDKEGRPISIGLEDLLVGLEKHWQENKNDIQRARLFAKELMKYGRFETAEGVLKKIVAGGGVGEDWLGLGIAQLQQKSWDDAIATLRGAQNLLTGDPFPSLHLARALKGKGEPDREREAVERAIDIDGNCVDAWAYLFSMIKEEESEDAALARIKELADAEPNEKRSAPYIAVQGVYSANEATRDKAIEYAKMAIQRNPHDPLALISLSALYGQKGDLKAVVDLLRPHESKMVNDVRLANNYFQALFQNRDIESATRLLKVLAGSQVREVKQFVVDKSRQVAQLLQQQQQRLAGTARSS